MKNEKKEVSPPATLCVTLRAGSQKSVASRGRACRVPIPFCHSCARRCEALWRSGGGGNPGIKAVLFDFDGTLTVPGLIDFMAIKKAINCPGNSTILEFIAALSSAGEQRKAMNVLERYEDKAAKAAKPNENAEEIVLFLHKKGLKLGILTRNRLRSVQTSMKCFQKISQKNFDVIVTREHELKLKPHPEGVLFAARSFGILPREMAVVGDYVFDIEAGQKAGALTVFLESNHTTRRPDPPADFTIKRLDELQGIFDDRSQ